VLAGSAEEIHASGLKLSSRDMLTSRVAIAGAQDWKSNSRQRCTEAGFLGRERNKNTRGQLPPIHHLYNISQLTQPQSHSPPLTPASCHDPCSAKQKRACPPHYAAGRRGHLQQHDTGVPLLITPRQPPGIRVRLASGGLEVGHMVKFLRNGAGYVQDLSTCPPQSHKSSGSAC
jgi:hypothetical protein